MGDGGMRGEAWDWWGGIGNEGDILGLVEESGGMRDEGGYSEVGGEGGKDGVV